MARRSDAPTTGARRSVSTAAYTEIPMTRPLDPGRCPCGRRGGQDGFCDEHAGAVAFKVPVGPGGETLPAVWWHWPHPNPCPEGEAWMVMLPRGDAGDGVWACTHRTHALSEARGLSLAGEHSGDVEPSEGDELSEKATG